MQDLFNKINISYKCLSGVFFFFEKHKSSSNSNMLIYDSSN